MANKKGRRRRFKAVRQYRSEKWTASYLARDTSVCVHPRPSRRRRTLRSDCPRLRRISAGATGVLYVNVVVSNVDPPPTTYVQEISGRICFAR